MQKVILRENIVIDKSETAEVVENGIYMNGVIYGEPNLELIDTELDPVIQQDMIVDGAIVANPHYVPSE